MKQKKKEAKLKRRIEDYDKNHATDGSYTKPGSIKKSAGGRGRQR